MSATIAKKKKRGKRKPKCAAVSQPVAGKRLMKYDAKIGRMVEVDRLTGKTKPVEDSKNTDWLQPRAKNNRSQNVAGWPLVSNSAAIHPSQIGEMNKILARKGVKQTEHDAFGRPVFTDQKHRSTYLRARGFADLDAGYRDPAHSDTTDQLTSRNQGAGAGHRQLSLGLKAEISSPLEASHFAAL
jgi:hypothetical protein